MVRLRCGACDDFFEKKDKHVTCSACKKKYHGDCTKLSENEFKIMGSKTRLKWFCTICEDEVTDMLTNFEKFRKVSVAIEKMKDEIDNKVRDFEKKANIV